MAEQIDININARDNASRTFDNLNNKVTALQGKLEKLSSALAGLAIGAAINNAIKFADALQDISNSTGIATQNILDFSNAITLNGGSADQANNILLKFVQTIDEAASGGKNAQLAFQEVGVSLRDLGTLSEQDLLKQTIEGLGKIEDAGKRSSLALQLLGKGAKGVDIAGLAQGFSTGSVESIKFAEAIRRASEVQDRLDRAFIRIKLSILDAIAPIAGFIEKLDTQKLNEVIGALTKIALALAAVATVATAVGKAYNGIIFVLEKFGLTIATVAGAIIGIRSGFANLGKTIGIATNYIDRFLRATPQFDKANGLVKNLTTLFGKLGERLPYVASGFLQIGAAILTIISPIGRLVAGIYLIVDAINQLGEGKGFLDIIDNWALRLEKFVTENIPFLAAGINKLNDLLGMEASPLTKQKQDPRAALRKQEIADAERLRNEEKKRTDGLREANAYYEQQVKLIQNGVENFLKQNRETVRAIEFETQLVGKTENVVELQKALNDLTLKYSSEIQSLIQARDQLDSKEQGLIATYDKQIAKLREQLDVDKQRLTEAVQGLQTARMLEQARLQNIENTTKAIEAQIERQRTLGDLLVSANDKLKEAQFAGEQQQRSPLEQQLANIQEEARKAALEAGRVFAASFEGADLSIEQSQELANGLDQIAQRYKAIADVQTANLMSSRTFMQGWKEAFASYIDDATNAAKIASNAFTSITNNMNSAIDNFVKTGKLNFKDFAKSVIQDLIAIELKSQATKIFSAGSSMLGNFLGSLFGGAFAEGGNPPINKPSLVGEKGPELFVPKTAGTIIPNGGTGTMTGGMMNAPITNNYITNNINALDAKSVAQLFAENRKTLLGTVELARKEMPYNNR